VRTLLFPLQSGAFSIQPYDVGIEPEGRIGFPFVRCSIPEKRLNRDSLKVLQILVLFEKADALGAIHQTYRLDQRESVDCRNRERSHVPGG
jgi:hypothetical protein